MYLVKTLSAWASFEDQILNDQELKEYKDYAKEQQLLLEIEELWKNTKRLILKWFKLKKT